LFPSPFRRLMSIEEAKRALEENFHPTPVGTELIPILHAYNRVLSRDIQAPIDVPPFHRSTVDGYAVRAQDTFGAYEDHPIPLRVCGKVSVGETPQITVKSGEAAGIATGAPLPPGADAVVMLEYTVQKDDVVMVYRPVAVGENVMKAGSDIPKGETVLRKGQVLASREVGVLAALGFKEVEVYRQPRVAIFSTGAEVVEPGKPLTLGKIYDINQYSLSVAVMECGGSPIPVGILPDDEEAIRNALKEALASSDVVITSGGVSVGPTDVMPRVLQSLGRPGVIVCGVASKPGKPTTIAIIDGKPVFSLPGHPTSSLLMYYLFARPVILAMAGRPVEPLPTLDAKASSRMFSVRGRRTFVMVRVFRDEAGGWVAEPVPLGLSGAITTLAKADGFVVVHETQQFIDEGEPVKVHLLHPILRSGWAW